MTKRVAVMGAGGHARVVSSIIQANSYENTGFFDDSCKDPDELIHGLPVRGSFVDILMYRDSIQVAYLAVGDIRQRRKWYGFLAQHNFGLTPLIHPSVRMENDVRIGLGSVICVGATLCTMTRIGRGCIINTGCSIDHESSIGDFSHLGPGTIVAGRSHIGSNTFVGLNTSIIDGIKIGNDVVIGAGSVILSDVPNNAQVVGVWK